MPAPLEVARQTMLLQLRGRLYLVLLALALVLPAVFLFLPPDAGRIGGSEIHRSTAMALFAGILPLVVLFIACQAVHGDIEDRTSVFLFTQPLSRPALLAGKWLAVVGLGFLFAGVGLLVHFLVIRYGGRTWEGGSLPRWDTLRLFLIAALLAAIGYASVGALIAAFFRRPLTVSVSFVLLEQFVSRTPPEVGIRGITVADPVARILDGSSGDPLPGLGKLVAVCLALALWIYSRREYDSRPRE
jgi:ABC-type transport system involved in multi-copper enzyme maturation permease subunit